MTEATGGASPPQSDAVHVVKAGFMSPRTFTLVLLLIVYISNYADRQILNVLAVQIMQDMQISKSAFGFLSGLSFALFYATLGIPIAVLADRVSRKWILIASMTVWSVMTTLCGFAAGFWQLALARVGVGVGEAGGSPPSHSMISDLYSLNQRGTALAIYALGVPLGTALGNLVGGQIGGEFGWRAAFYVLGVPGILLAIYFAFVFKEPPRGHSDGGLDEKATVPGPLEVARFMLSQPSLVHTVIGATLITAVGYGGLTFTAAFLQYSHHLSLGVVANYLALQTGVVSAIGTFLGGYLADVLSKRNPGWSAWVVTAAIVISVPFTVAQYMLNDTTTVLWLMTVSILVAGLYLAPTFALVQNLVGVRMRATAAALLLFVINLVGLGAGPLLVGIIADALTPIFHEDAVRYALFIFSSLGLWGAWHYWVAPRTLKADLERAANA
ncbi:MAG: MFS transporter [Micropepsaceae bacterium]